MHVGARIAGYIRSVTIIVSLTLATSAGACPLCDSDTGKELRGQIFGSDFSLNVLKTLAPFPIVIAMVWLVCRIIPEPNVTTTKKSEENGYDNR